MNIMLILGITALVGIIIVLAISIYETGRFRIKKYVFYSPKVSKEIRFGFISDLHNCSYGEKNRKLCRTIENLNLDFLILGGDLICGKRNIKGDKPEKYYKNAAYFLNDLPEKQENLYVFGNHETRVKNRREKNPLYDSYLNAISKSNVSFFNNCSKVMCDELEVFGFEISESAYKNQEHIEPEKVADKEKYNVLVAHTPDYFDEYVKKEYDLILCGHYHGGTVRIPGINKGIVSRDFKLFPKYSYGLYKKRKSTMLVTAGLGDHTIHFRVFNMPEIVEISIVPEKVFEK